jgi:5-methylcytosine-specific restriction enzyme subunit McrC
MQIPVQNIYYLLCYAWDKLDQKDKVSVSTDGITELIDLLAKVLINASRILLKRGFDRDYLERREQRAGIKGKLEISESVKRNSLIRLQAVCTYDEYTFDIRSNQILFTTLYRLLYTENLSSEFKPQVRKLLRKFPKISVIDLSRKDFKAVKIHRNNRFYAFIINVCELIFENSLPDEKDGEWMFQDFTRDERKMAYLFEEFVFQFYSKERSALKPSRKKLKWNFETSEPNYYSYLPEMRTDITLDGESERIIIDTKYYQETMNMRFNQDKIKSENLYQLFSYLLNQEDGTSRSEQTKGVLLYPTIDQEYNLAYRYQSHPIEIRTVNLNAHWMEIEKRLLDIVQ